MTPALSHAVWLELLSLARRHARGSIEPDDLLQDALVAALAAGRTVSGENRAWLAGTMRNIAAMNARGTARRRRRETEYASLSVTGWSCRQTLPDLDGLTSSLRIVALLALSGHSRAEIRQLLRITDQALRQRISGLRRALSKSGHELPEDFTALHSRLAFGAIRCALLPLIRAGGADFASHDPDGHAIAFKSLRPVAHKLRGGGNMQSQTS